MNSQLFYALGVVADSLTVNGFDKTGKLQELASELWPEGQFHSFIIVLGENLTIHSRASDSGVTRIVVGDREHALITIEDYGTDLAGPVSVRLKTEKVVGALVHLHLEVRPLSHQDGPLLGTMWINDVRSIGFSRVIGSAVFSVNQMMIPDPSAPFAALKGTVSGLTMALVPATEGEVFDYWFENTQVFGDNTIVTPFGVCLNSVPDIFPVASKPMMAVDGMLDKLQVFLSYLYQNGVCIFNQNAARAELQKQGFSEEVIEAVLRLFNGAAKKGDWLTSLHYAGSIYYLPTPRLLASL